MAWNRVLTLLVTLIICICQWRVVVAQQLTYGGYGDGPCAITVGDTPRHATCWIPIPPNSNSKTFPSFDVRGDFGAIIGGYNAGCALDRYSGAAQCWGRYGPLPMGWGYPVSGKIDVTLPGSGWTQISMSISLLCALDGDSKATCFGSNQTEQLVIPTPPPGSPLPYYQWDFITPGEAFVCGSLKAPANQVICWGGRSLYGQLGSCCSPWFPTMPTDAQTGADGRVTRVAQLILSNYRAPGIATIFALMDNGILLQISHPTVAPPLPVANRRWSQVACTNTPTGFDYCCGVAFEGTLECSGLDIAGEASPPPGNTFSMVVVGGTQSCAVTTPVSQTRNPSYLPGYAEVKCWGSASAPTITPGFARMIAGDPNLTAGGYYNNNGYCAIMLDGSLSLNNRPQIIQSNGTYIYTAIATNLEGCCALSTDPAAPVQCFRWQARPTEGASYPFSGYIQSIGGDAGGVQITSITSGSSPTTNYPMVCGLLSNGTAICSYHMLIIAPDWIPFDFPTSFQWNSISISYQDTFCGVRTSDTKLQCINLLTSSRTISEQLQHFPDDSLLPLTGVIAGFITMNGWVVQFVNDGTAYIRQKTNMSGTPSYRLYGNTTYAPTARISIIKDSNLNAGGPCFLNTAGEIGCVLVPTNPASTIFWTTGSGPRFTTFSMMGAPGSGNSMHMCGISGPIPSPAPTAGYDSGPNQVHCFNMLQSMTPTGPPPLPLQIVTTAIPGTYAKGILRPSCAGGTYSVLGNSVTSICSGVCNGGTYGSTVSIDSSCQGLAPAGRYAPPGSSAPIDCAAGRYGVNAGMDSSDCSGICPAAFYCPQASTAFIACPPGRFGSSTGLSNSTCDGECAAGYFCGLASKDPIQNPCGASSLFCPPHSGQPKMVDLGFYGIGSVDGTSNTFTDRARCPSGYACNGGGIPRACPAGTQSGTGGSLGGSIACSDCPPGKFSPNDTMILCLPCPPGKFTSEIGQTICQDCIEGKFSLDETGAILCQPCGSGTATNDRGQTACETCVEGKFALIGQKVCTECDFGYYQPQPGQVSCLPCHAGWSSSITGATQCDKCQPGEFSGQAAKECSKCDRGFISTHETSLTCLGCDPGKATNLTGQSECANCVPGRFAPNPGSNECLECTSGRFTSTDGGSAFCQDCFKGTSSNLPGFSGVCADCVPGRYAADPGATSCSVCESGRYTSEYGTIRCQVCEGLIVKDQTVCNATQPCPANKEKKSTLLGDHYCSPCALGRFSPSGGDCQDCSLNTYTPTIGSGCVSCLLPGMDGLSCTGGFANVKAGYWAFLVDDPEHPGVRIFHTASCPLDLCPGAVLQTPEDDGGGGINSPAGSVDPGSGTPINLNITSSSMQCPPKRRQSFDNYLCAACADGYIEMYGDCIICPSVQSGWIILVIIISFAFVTFLLTTSGSSAGYSNILVYFLQTAALEVGSATVLLDFLKVFNFSITGSALTGSSSACLGPMTPLEQMMLSLITPALLVGELAVIGVIHFMLHRFFGVDGARLTPGASLIKKLFHHITSKPHFARYISGVCAILLFNYTAVASTCLSFLNCIEISPDKPTVVFNEPTIDCHSSAYKSYLALVLVVFIGYIILWPLGVLWLLKRRLTWIAQEADSDQSRASVIDSRPSVELEFLSRFAPLFAPFRSTTWFWQVLILLRRVVFVTVDTFLQLQPSIRAMTFMIFNFLSFCLQSIYQPYRDIKLNRADQIAHASLILISTLLAGYASESNSLPTGVVIGLFFLIVPIPAGMLIQMARGVHAARLIRRATSTKQLALESGDDDSPFSQGAGSVVPRSPLACLTPIRHLLLLLMMSR